MDVTCQCSSVSFPLTAPLLDLYHCHCLECQRQSSSAFGTSAIFPSSSFAIPTEVQSKLSKWTRPTKEGRTMDCYFCQECGSRIYHHIREADGTLRDTVSVKGGVIRGLKWKGSKHIYMRSAVVEIPDGVEKWEGTPAAMVGRRPNANEASCSSFGVGAEWSPAPEGLVG
ncbi:putative glutathione-dependent formaldehyde-activating enzyme protein [Triangularia verruculosa]|uniref:Glutathione-dependent formaldehyde-activating enzyme protein n=1 Tax=Triangularia verruculosa TaxID=2587418 RepID=A0AAN6X8I1_9PEZI|nr:putative glutathione-dependent formaldehyde-activating enzyme protein [Triangularia verruculosa]